MDSNKDIREALLLGYVVGKSSTADIDEDTLWDNYEKYILKSTPVADPYISAMSFLDKRDYTNKVDNIDLYDITSIFQIDAELQRKEGKDRVTSMLLNTELNEGTTEL